MEIHFNGKTGGVALVFGFEERDMAKQTISDLIDRGKTDGDDVSGLCEALEDMKATDGTRH